MTAALPLLKNVRARILVVTNERSVRAVLQRALGRSKHQVDCVESTEAALEQMDTATPDLLIVDMALPGMGGLELLRHVRKDRGQDIWPIMVTASPAASSARDTLHPGVCAYLEKPLTNILDVVERIEEVLALKRTCDRVRSSTERLRARRIRVDPTRPRLALAPPNEPELGRMVARPT